MRRVGLAEVEDARWGNADSVLFFITDRCPVGCAHCSVDSRADSPRITDFPLFEGIVEALSGLTVGMIGISGGEPFVERRALPYAVERFGAVGKDVVVYTSGYWAVRQSPAPWIRNVISQCSCIYLSTDSFHRQQIAEFRFKNAAAAIAAEGVPLVVQVIDLDGMPNLVENLLADALGPGWPRLAEIKVTQPLPYGRASNLFAEHPVQLGTSFGSCRVARVPVIRYDGVIAGCCNEAVLMGGGPDFLRRRARSGAEVTQLLVDLNSSPLMQVIAHVGVGDLLRHPKARDIASRKYSSICGACWSSIRVLQGDKGDGLLSAMAALAGASDPMKRERRADDRNCRD